MWCVRLVQLMIFPFTLSGIAEARVSMNRIQSFLVADEVVSVPQVEDPNSSIALEVRDGCFEWRSAAPKHEAQLRPPHRVRSRDSFQPLEVIEEESSGPVVWSLKEIDMTVRKGSYVCVVGAVGSGKSSLLQACLGEMKRVGGEVALGGRVSYVAQQAWIQNATLRENILFGKEFDEHRYRQTLLSCALEQDIAMLPAGDQTEIGERGINLSGGQKQRVSLARAVYSDALIYLLDDPLSAVDAYVGRHIFERCIRGQLLKKTVVLVTNQLQYVPSAERVFVMHEGTIVEQGTHDELLRRPDGVLRKVMKSHHRHVDETIEGTSGISHSAPPTPTTATPGISDNEAEYGRRASEALSTDALEGVVTDKRVVDNKGGPRDGHLVEKEEREKGHISSAVYREYAVASGGLRTGAEIVVWYVFAQALRVMTDSWLAAWSSRSFRPDPGVLGSLGVYLGLTFLQVCAQLFRGLRLAVVGVQAGRVLHAGAIARILRAGVRFFDVTPAGRIISRVSKDVDSIDSSLPLSVQQFLNTLFLVISSFCMIVVIIPWFAPALVPVVLVFFVLQKHYRYASRELKRLDSISRTPLYSHLSETLGGVATLRAFQKQKVEIARNTRFLERNMAAYRAQVAAMRWVAVRLECMASAAVGLAAVLVVSGRSALNAGFGGLCLVYAMCRPISAVLVCDHISDSTILCRRSFLLQH